MENKKMPTRKRTRIQGYDYAQNGAYFVTICTYGRNPILSWIDEGQNHENSMVNLKRMGFEIKTSIEYINENYQNVSISKFIIMPNHVHMIIELQTDKSQRINPSLNDVVGQFKSYTTKRYNEINKTKYEQLWQRSFYDHVIRNEREYLDVWQYIDINSLKWQLDEYHTTIPNTQ